MLGLLFLAVVAIGNFSTRHAATCGEIDFDMDSDAKI